MMEALLYIEHLQTDITRLVSYLYRTKRMSVKKQTMVGQLFLMLLSKVLDRICCINAIRSLRCGEIIVDERSES
jgi:hypothetical protein